MLELVRHCELCRFKKVERDEAGDIGDRECVARNEGTVLELAVNEGDELEDARLVRLGPGGHLRHFHRLHCWMRVPKDMRDGKQEMQLEPSIPHLDARNLESATAEQRRLGL